MRLIALVVIAGVLAATPCARAEPPAPETASLHAGFFYPNGVDAFGYTVEREVWTKLHSFYTFGFPALAAAGVAYYTNYAGNGWVSTAGIGLGFAGYAAVSYQLKVSDDQFIKVGIGAASGILANGAYPSLSYEWRLR